MVQQNFAQLNTIELSRKKKKNNKKANLQGIIAIQYPHFSQNSSYR